MEQTVERETKFDVGAEFRLPDVEELLGEQGRIERSTIHLSSTYFDTADLSLLAHHATLRRRVGDTDSGWQLKIPAGPARSEIRLPLDGQGDDRNGSAVPLRLNGLVRGLAHGGELRPVAVVETKRHILRLHIGTELGAEVADDEVHGTDLRGEVRHTRWREIEVELGAGDAALLDTVGERLIDAGARPADSSSKLARVLGRPDPVRAAESDAARLMADYLSQQVAALTAGDVALRRGLDPVHKTRVAVRRFRSILRVFSTVFDSEQPDWLENELSWFQDLLGEVRDRQVQRARFAQVIKSLPVEIVMGPVAADIDSRLLAEQLAAAGEVNTALEGDRYARLQSAIVRFAGEPPIKPGVAPEDLLACAENAHRKARKRLRQAVTANEAAALHRARKACKRARYSIELVAPATGNRAKKTIKRLRRAQDTLGEHQDSTVAADLIRGLGATQGSDDGRNGFTYGALWQREQVTAHDALKRAVDLKV